MLQPFFQRRDSPSQFSSSAVQLLRAIKGLPIRTHLTQQRITLLLQVIGTARLLQASSLVSQEGLFTGP